MLPRTSLTHIKRMPKSILLRFKSENNLVPPKNTDNKLPTKEELQWRTPMHLKPNEWYTKFKLFEPEVDNHAEMLKWFRQPIDIRPSAFMRWWENKKLLYEVYDQRFIPERHEILGSELAAAFFVVHRGGTIKFSNMNAIVKRDENHEYDLPTRYSPEYIVEEINCEGMVLYYEGLENMTDLKKIKYLSVKGCQEIDDWCLDRISGQFHKTLEELDIRDCPKITEKGICALYRMRKLKLLHVNGFENSKSFELVSMYLEDMFPQLKIVSG